MMWLKLPGLSGVIMVDDAIFKITIKEMHNEPIYRQ